MKKIAFFIPTMGLGGAQKEISVLLKYFPCGAKIVLILMGGEVLHEVPKGVEIVYLERTSQSESYILKFLKLPFLAYKLKKVCKLHEVDTVLSFLTRANYIGVLSKIFKNPAYIIINERSFPSKMYENGLNGYMNRFLMKTLFPKADKITANSKEAKDDLEKNYHCKDVFVFYNPIDLEFIQSVKPVKREFSRPVFITIGRLHEVKNQSLLIDAMGEIDAILYIIGDGELKEELSKQIKNLNLQDKVFLLGSKTNPYTYLKSADVFVLTSLFEGFPTVLLEALACELPVVSSDCENGPREILSYGKKGNFENGCEVVKYGVLTKVDDKNSLVNAMKFMLKSHVRERFRDISKSRAEEFDVKKALDNLNNILL